MNRADHMDIVYIRDLRASARIGVYDWERQIRQTVSLDVDMAADIAGAAATDHVDQTVNYKSVAKRLIAFVQESDFALVETLAQRAAEVVLDEFAVAWVRLRVDKPGAVRHAASVGVVIERWAQGGRPPANG